MNYWSKQNQQKHYGHAEVLRWADYNSGTSSYEVVIT